MFMNIFRLVSALRFANFQLDLPWAGRMRNIEK